MGNSIMFDDDDGDDTLAGMPTDIPRRTKDDGGVIPLRRNTGDKRTPNDMGATLLLKHKLVCDPNKLVFEYVGHCWKERTPLVVESWAMSEDTFDHTSQKRRRETASFALGRVMKVDGIPWRHNLSAATIPVENGIYDLETGTVRPHDPDDFIESTIPWRYDPSLKGGRPTHWFNALARWFKGDPDIRQKVHALQEWFGYCLMPVAPYKTAFILHGDGDTGKSRVSIALKNLVGFDNVCALSVDSLGDPRKVAPIRGKSLNIMSELTRNALLADDGFKKLISGGDPIQIDPKHQAPYMYVPYCKHMIVTNSLPRVTDESAATFNRMVILEFNRVIAKADQDPKFDEKIISEMPQILAWAIEGAERLYKNSGVFTPVPSSVERVEQYKKEQNPVLMFLEEECTKDNDCHIPLGDFKERFREWHGPRVTTRTLRAWLRDAKADPVNTRRGGIAGYHVLGYALNKH